MPPSNLWYRSLLSSQYSWITSSMITIWLKMSTLSPASLNLVSNLSSKTSLPEP